MQSIRTGMRLAGRLAIFIFCLTILITALANREPTHQVYLQKYDNFRDLLYIKRILDLPPANFIEGLFDIFFWVDFCYLSMTGLLLLCGKRLGGCMMVLYFCIKITVWYLPALLNTPRMPFTVRDRLEMARHIAILGVALAFTSPVPSHQKDTHKEESGGEEQKSKTE